MPDYQTEQGFRKSPEEIIQALMEALGQNQKTTDQLSVEIGSSWETVWKYLKLIIYVQSCPKVINEKVGKRIETWKREWGRLPK